MPRGITSIVAMESASTALDEVARGKRIGIGIPVLGELWFGVENSASREQNMHRLLAAISDWTLWPYDDRVAQEYGRIAAELGQGRPFNKST